MRIELDNKGFNVGSFYNLYKIGYDCWTVKDCEKKDVKQLIKIIKKGSHES